MKHESKNSRKVFYFILTENENIMICYWASIIVYFYTSDYVLFAGLFSDKIHWKFIRR